MPYSAKAVANYFLDLASGDGKTLDPMQIQKLVYYAHGWHLAIIENPLIDENVEAWRWGPVIPSLYHEFKRFGSGPISGHAHRVRMIAGGLVLSTPRIEETIEDGSIELTKAILNQIWKVYGDFTGLQLSTMTHAPGTPWAEIRGTTKGRKGANIHDDIIKKHFTEQLNVTE